MKNNVNKRPQLVVASLVNTSATKAGKILERYSELCAEYHVASTEPASWKLHEMSPLEQVLDAIDARAKNFVRPAERNALVTTIDDQYYAVLRSDNIEAALKNASCDMPTRKAAALLRQAILENVPPEPDLSRGERAIG